MTSTPEEHGPDLSRAAWRKSSHSGGNGSCVEVAENLPGIIAVRDSKNPGSPALVFDPADWDAFVTSLRSGNLHL